MELITGEHFQNMADFTFSPNAKASGDYNNLPNTLKIDNLFNGCTIYTHTVYAKELLKIIETINKRVIVITHNYDYNIDNSYIVPENIIMWFAQNVNTVNPKIQSIPIGLENRWWFIETNKKGKMLNKLTEPKIYKNLIYVNHAISTNPKERNLPYEILKDKPYATLKYGKNGSGFDEYLNDIYSHKFVVSPEGNGIDTHRTWECLYMNTIPIEKININNQFYTDLPICFVSSWEELTEDFLLSEYYRIKSKNWNLEKLNFEYWKEIINSFKLKV